MARLHRPWRGGGARPGVGRDHARCPQGTGGERLSRQHPFRRALARQFPPAPPRWRMALVPGPGRARAERSEEHTSELQSLMRISYAVFCLKKKKAITTNSIV